MFELARCPISVESKSHKDKRYFKSKFYNGYLYLNADKRGNIGFSIIIKNEKNSFRIKFQKWYILEMIKHHLSFKNIFQQKDNIKHLWLNEKIKDVNIDIHNSTDDEIIEGYRESMDEIKKMYPNISEQSKIKANNQMKELIKKLHRADLMDEIKKTNKMIENNFT